MLSLAVPGLEVDVPFRAQYDWQSTEGLDDARIRQAEVSQVRLGEHDGFFVINGRIKVTFEHPFLVRRGDQWGFCSADLLRVGDMLVTPDLAEEPINTIERTRPDRTFRTWWRSRPDEAALNDPALELVLPETAELAEIPGDLLAPDLLPGLWPGDEITAQDVSAYFDGSKVVQVDRGGYPEPMPVPRAASDAVDASIADAVENGRVWLLAGPASLLSEPIPAGVLTPSAKLHRPPAPISAAALLPENLQGAWQDGKASALAIATALSQDAGSTLPWKTVRDAISGAVQARFIELTEESETWPCDFASAKGVHFKPAEAQPAGGGGTGGGGRGGRKPNVQMAEAEFEPSQLQDLGDAVPRLLDIKAKTNVAMRFHVRLEIGDGETPPEQSVLDDVNDALEGLGDSFRVS